MVQTQFLPFSRQILPRFMWLLQPSFSPATKYCENQSRRRTRKHYSLPQGTDSSQPSSSALRTAENRAAKLCCHNPTNHWAERHNRKSCHTLLAITRRWFSVCLPLIIISLPFSLDLFRHRRWTSVTSQTAIFFPPAAARQWYSQSPKSAAHCCCLISLTLIKIMLKGQP